MLTSVSVYHVETHYIIRLSPKGHPFTTSCNEHSSHSYHCDIVIMYCHRYRDIIKSYYDGKYRNIFLQIKRNRYFFKTKHRFTVTKYIIQI